MTVSYTHLVDSLVGEALLSHKLCSKDELPERVAKTIERCGLARYHMDIQSLTKKINFNKYRLKYLKIYRKYKPINEAYKKAVFQDRYFRNHEDELLLFQEAVEELKKTEKTRELPNAGKLAADIKSLEEEKNKLISGNKSIDKKLKEYDVLKNNLAKMLLDEPENKLENVQKLQQKQVQRNKEDIQI